MYYFIKIPRLDNTIIENVALYLKFRAWLDSSEYILRKESLSSY